MKTATRFLQINLHHAKAASAAACCRFIKNNLDYLLIQEPWVRGGKICGLPTNSCKIIYDNKQLLPRAAILVNDRINFLPIPQFVSRDLVAISVDLTTSRGRKSIIIASSYFADDDQTHAPPDEVARLLEYSARTGQQIILGFDSNAHHTIWGSANINNTSKFPYFL